MVETLTSTPVTLSDSAAARIAFLASQETKPGAMLRLGVDGGGCSGFQYTYDFIWQSEATDLVVEHNGATLVIDDVSLDFLKGAMLDYEEDLSGAAFVVKNPNSTANCGCGNSFATAM